MTDLTVLNFQMTNSALQRIDLRFIILSTSKQLKFDFQRKTGLEAALETIEGQAHYLITTALASKKMSALIFIEDINEPLKQKNAKHLNKCLAFSI